MFTNIMKFIYWPTFCTVVLVLLTGVGGLRDVEIRAPLAVAPGKTATLICKYDLEGDPLYTVKWYKGREEFFRYIPKELPHTRVFPMPGINVDINASGADRVVLRDVQKELSGKYRCEVSADAPNFHTKVVSTHMHVTNSTMSPRYL
uniref:Ig-like domain-containing protein n=1 Tax=Clastoptera arizonana TaxID=38151 RepID=A0A1B6CNQ3_9HEMI